jgi:hypothetical protein
VPVLASAASAAAVEASRTTGVVVLAGARNTLLADVDAETLPGSDLHPSLEPPARTPRIRPFLLEEGSAATLGAVGVDGHLADVRGNRVLLCGAGVIEDLGTGGNCADDALRALTPSATPATRVDPPK